MNTGNKDDLHTKFSEPNNIDYTTKTEDKVNKITTLNFICVFRLINVLNGCRLICKKIILVKAKIIKLPVNAKRRATSSL